MKFSHRGHALVMFGVAFAFHASAQAQKIYWSSSNPNGVRRANLDGTQQELLTNDFPSFIRTVELDPGLGRMYFAGVWSAKLDGSNLAHLYSTQYAQSFAIDHARQKVYELGWADDSGTNAVVSRSNLDGSGYEVLVSNAVSFPFGVALDVSSRRIYFGEWDGIYRMNYDGSGIEHIISGEFGIGGIAIDMVAGKIYWGLGGNPPYHVGSLKRANLNGSNVEVVVENAHGVSGVAIHSEAQKVFWTNRYSVFSANLNGSEVELLIDFPIASNARGIVVDDEANAVYFGCASGTNSTPGIYAIRLDSGTSDLLTGDATTPWGLAVSDGWLYWTDAGGAMSPAKVCRLHIESGEQQIIAESDDLHNPAGIAIDFSLERLFWADDLAGKIWHSSLDGSSAEVLVGRVIDGPVAIAFDSNADKIYWTSRRLNGAVASIGRCSLNGSEVEEVVPGVPNYPGDLALDPIREMVYWLDLENGERVIRRAKFDGSDVQSLIGTIGIYESVLAIDSAGERMYWSTDSTIDSADLDGNDHYVLVTGVGGIGGLAVNSKAHIDVSIPTRCSIDARQPHDVNDASLRYGWNSLELQFSGEVAAIGSDNFEMIESGGDGVPPGIESVEIVGPAMVRVTLDDTIEPGAWTCFYHINSGTKSCLGYLPGDVNGDGTASPVDVLRLIDSFNGVVDPPYEVWQTDTNRSGVAESSDILRLIDLLNGAGAFEVWNGRTIGECP